MAPLKIKMVFIWALFLAGVLPPAFAQEDLPAVKLMTPDKPAVLPAEVQSRLRRQLTALLQSSNFHSGPDDKQHIFTLPEVQQDYRDSVIAGKYLLLIFSSAQKIRTAGGEVTVTEIIVGLRRPNSKNSVFTIDDSGRVIGHAKYSGTIFVELEKTVAEVYP